MKIIDIQNVIELLKLAKFGESMGAVKEGEKPELKATSYNLYLLSW